MGIPLTTSPHTVLRDAIAIMHQAKASCVVVVDANKPVGIFTEHDCVQWMARGINPDTVAISSLMPPQLVTLNMTDLQNPVAALETMQHHQIHHLPVIDESGELVDLVTPTSLRDMLHPSDFMQLLRVEEVMTTQNIFLARTTTVATVLQNMAQHRVRSVVIVDQPLPTPAHRHRPIGILTERDMVHLQATNLPLDETQVGDVMSSPLLTIAPQENLWVAHEQMQAHQVRRLVVCNTQGHFLGMITQHGIFQAMQPSEMLNVVHLLRETVKRLQNENIELLQKQNHELEKQMRVRKLLENRLRASQQQMRAVFEAMHDIVLVCELQGQDIVNIELSPTYPEQFEQPDLDPATQTIAHMWRDPDQLWTHHLRTAITQQRRVEFDYSLSLGDRQAWFTASISPMSEQFVVCVAHDITERKQFEQQLQQLNTELVRSNEELERFAYVASHDLQEPLRMVISFTKLLADRYADQLDTEANEIIDFAVDGATRMQQLIQDLLSYARVGMGSPQPVAVNLEEVLQDVLANLQVAIAENNATVECQAMPTVMGDARQYTQLFQNLIANALTYRRTEQPQILVGAQTRDQDYLLWVKDNGLGIAPQHLERIFTVFQRLHSRSKYPGTGIGLAICKKIVEQHGGQIWVESELDQGSSFLMTFPKPLA